MIEQLTLHNDELVRRQNAIRIISIGIFAATGLGAIGMLVAWLFDPTFPIVSVITFDIVALAVTVIAYWLNRSGYAKLAGYFLVASTLLLASAATAQLGGFSGPLAVTFLFPILISGIVISMNASFYVATVATVLYLGIIPLEVSGILPQIISKLEPQTPFPVLNVIAMILMYYLVALLSWFAASRLNMALQNVRKYATELQTANEKLRANEEELRAANEELQASEEELRASNEELGAANEELREAQEQLLRSERLAAIGQLAGGVGHELRNPLGAIKNAVYYIRGRLNKIGLAENEPRVMEFLGIVDEEINSSNKIINDLLNFSRVGKPATSPARIEAVIEDALAHSNIPEGVKLVKDLSDSLPDIDIDTDQIRQVLVNIITNAVQAMPDGGRVTIGTGQGNGYLEVAVSDTGIGMSKEVMGKIFNPLFTTRAKGIGLGLAVCKTIVERHEGKIEVSSEEGKGSTFTVKLPLRRSGQEVKTSLEANNG